MGSISTGTGRGVDLVQRLDGRPVGWVRELRLLDGLIEPVEGGGSAALIVGEAGVGKTAILTHVADVASKRAALRVLKPHGEESEAVLAFATLADLLLPLREKFAELPQTQRLALEVYLAPSSRPAAGPLAACAGALGVLANAADEQSLAVLIDDFQWVDPESRQILLFTARRLEAKEPGPAKRAAIWQPGRLPSCEAHSRSDFSRAP